MKTLLSSLLLLFIVLGYGQETELESVRKAFHKAVIDEAESENFHSMFSEIEGSSPTIAAYRAVSEALLGRTQWNPFSKLTQVHKYQKAIAEAVSLEPDNVEIRFLRLAIEYNLPPFLGMSDHVQEDLEVILDNMDSVSSLNVDPGYGRYIFYFIESTELCSSDQILAMRESLGGQSAQ